MIRYHFQGHTVDVSTVEVHGPDGPRAFEPQVFKVLLYLLEQRGRLVTKEELLDNIWGDRFISESALTTRIKQTRRLVGDDGRTQGVIKTVHGRGYRFIAEVEVEELPIAVTSAGADGSIPTADPQDEGADHPTSVPGVDADQEPKLPARSMPGELAAALRRLIVGRDREVTEAFELIDRSGADPVRWVWLLGEPGIGKTRAAAEIANVASKAGHRVLFGRNNEDLSVPFQPVIEALRTTVTDLSPDEAIAVLGPRAAELTRLLPELAGSVASPDPAELGVDDNSRRYQLMEAIAEWLSIVSAAGPVLFVIDDVHWASDSTIQFLNHLHYRLQNCAVTIVATARDTAPDEHPRIADLTAATAGSDQGIAIHLGGLTDAAAARLVGGEADLVHAMELTAGNPLLLQALNPADPSTDLASAVRRRLASLDESVQQTMSLAAIIGLEFDLKVASAALGRDELDVLDDVEDAVAAKLLEDVGADRFRFTHALIRNSLRADVSSGRRTRWHARVADAIDTVFPDHERELPALAHHTAEAAVADPSLRPVAVARLRRSAEIAADQYSFVEAAQYLQRARSLADRDDRLIHAELAIAQGDAEMGQGASTLAARTYDAAVTDARRAGAAELLAAAAIRYSSVSWRPGTGDSATLDRATEALAVLESAVADGQEIEDEAALRARLHIGIVRAHAMVGDFDSTDAAFESALALIEPMGDVALEAELLTAYLSDLRSPLKQSRIDDLWERLAEIHHHLAHYETQLLGLQIRFYYTFYRSRFDDHLGLLTDMQLINDSVQSTFWSHIIGNDEAMLALHHGDLARTEELAEHCLELASELPDEDGSGAYGLRMFMVRREQDRLAGLAPLLRMLVDGNEPGAFWTPGLALLSVETGRTEDAVELLADFRRRNFAIPVDAMWGTVMALLVEVAVAVSDEEACHQLRRRFAVMEGMTIVTGHGILSLGAVDRYLGMASHVLGELRVAEQQLASALEIDSRGGSTLWANHSRLWLARTLRAQGHAAEADAITNVVLTEAAEAGLPRLVNLATADLDG